MLTRISIGLLGITAVLGAFCAAGVAKADTGFQRPDCSSYKELPLPEATCFRKAKLAVRDANYAALQKTGLEFAYLARPPVGKELDHYPEAKKAAEDKAEGEFVIGFSVNTDGNVYDIKVVSASSAPIGALARLWADTIAQWKFAKIASPVTNVPFRRIYLYSHQDDDKRSNKSGG